MREWGSVLAFLGISRCLSVCLDHLLLSIFQLRMGIFVEDVCVLSTYQGLRLSHKCPPQGACMVGGRDGMWIMGCWCEEISLHPCIKEVFE